MHALSHSPDVDRSRHDGEQDLLQLAATVPLSPPIHCAVFYTRPEGASAAARRVEKGGGYVRLDDLLQQSAAGRRLWQDLQSSRHGSALTRAAWCELSARLAASATGVVHVWGPPQREHPATVFASIELPALLNNPKVSAIYYNGRPIGFGGCDSRLPARSATTSGIDAVLR